MRAVAGVPGAEFRRALLFAGDQGVSLLAPCLALDVATDSITRCRGVADAMALRLAHSDLRLHAARMPEGTAAAIVFDTLEQLRVESLAPEILSGVRHNLDAAFNEWCRASRGSGWTESEVGLLIYSVTQIARSHLLGAPQDEEVEGLIESTRFRLSAHIGHALRQLYLQRQDQSAYAESALSIAHVIEEIVGVLDDDLPAARAPRSLRQWKLPRSHPESGRQASVDTEEEAIAGGIPCSGSYRVFCREYDREVTGSEVVPLASRRQAFREQLDRLVKAQAVSISQLAQRLKRLFSVPVLEEWNFGEEDGYLDGRRLSQIVANPSYRRVFRQRCGALHSETVISFLIDNSGSMKRQRYEAVTVLVDLYSRALDLAGVPNEILGFTTAGWNGGQSIRAWRRHGSPVQPGRLNDRLHIVYKDAQTPWRRARGRIAALLSTNHYREGLDGEALQWAAERLLQYPARRRCLVMISDGAPMETATSLHNADGFLENHLRAVIRSLEQGGSIELTAISSHLELDPWFSRSLVLDLQGTLGNAEFRALETLYSDHRLY